MSKAIAVAKPSIESEGAESHQPSPHATKSRRQKLIDAPRQSKHLPTRRPPSMIFSHGRLVSSRLSRRSHPDCRATPRGGKQFSAENDCYSWLSGKARTRLLSRGKAAMIWADRVGLGIVAILGMLV